MKYTEEMILQSESGYCMPFEERQGKDCLLYTSISRSSDSGDLMFGKRRLTLQEI